MGGSGLDRLPADSKAEAEGHPGPREEQLWELCEGRLRARDMPKDIATQMAGILPG